MEALDSDDLRNEDGDEAVDPPSGWSEADKIGERGEADESLDDKLAAERPDVAGGGADMAGDGDTELLAGDRIDHIAAEDRGRDAGQISGTPEDGDSLYPVVE